MGEDKKKKSKIKYLLSILFLILLIVVTFVVLFTKYSFSDLILQLKLIKMFDYDYEFY